MAGTRTHTEGCGHGLPGLFVLRAKDKGPARWRVVFSDFNEDVLERCVPKRRLTFESVVFSSACWMLWGEGCVGGVLGRVQRWSERSVCFKRVRSACLQLSMSSAQKP